LLYFLLTPLAHFPQVIRQLWSVILKITVMWNNIFQKSNFAQIHKYITNIYSYLFVKSIGRLVVVSKNWVKRTKLTQQHWGLVIGPPDNEYYRYLNYTKIEIYVPFWPDNETPVYNSDKLFNQNVMCKILFDVTFSIFIMFWKVVMNKSFLKQVIQ